MELLSVPSRLGTFFLGGEAGHIIRLYLPGDPTPRIAEHETPVLSEARRQPGVFGGPPHSLFLPPGPGWRHALSAASLACLGGNPLW